MTDNQERLSETGRKMSVADRLTKAREAAAQNRLLRKQHDDELRAEVRTLPVKVVDVATGDLVQTLNMAEGGNHIVDQGKLYIRR